MKGIIIGNRVDSVPVELNLDTLITTRLLIQANSGGGKSWVLRRLAEQLFGKVPVVIIDPEGEFASLREKFGFVLVGEGGETPADPRSAAQLAEKLLELRASAVCDIYEAFRSRPMDRRQWVRHFLNALLDAPRSLWHPMIVIVDEAHKFCPQETPKAASNIDKEIIGGCKDAMVGLATVGRKRGFCPVWATQRLAKVDKDASAELFNRLVGMTIEDVDVDRAADLMSVSKEDKHDFRASLRNLQPGQFYAFGRAISNERVLLKAGEVQTTHPESGISRKDGPPPMPASIKHLLPQLADLPREAEEKARTVAELQKEVMRLKRELASSQKPQADPQAIERAVVIALQKQSQQFKLESGTIERDNARLREGFQRIGQLAEQFTSSATPQIDRGAFAKVIKTEPVPPPRKIDQRKDAPPPNGAEITGPMQRILNACAWLESIGVSEPKQAAVAFLAGYTVGGGAFNNPRGALNRLGLIQYRGEAIALTDAGRAVSQSPDSPLTTQELHNRVMQQLPSPEQKILRVLLDRYPDAMDNDALARQSGYEPGGGAFNNPRGRLRTLGLVDYPQKGMVKAASLLFLEAA